MLTKLEIFPTHMRAQGVAASIGGLFAMTLLYTEAASTAFAHVGWKYYLVFIIVPACGVPILARFPETKGLTLEEIAAVFGDEVAMDLSHLTVEQREDLDKQIISGGGVDAEIARSTAAAGTLEKGGHHSPEHLDQGAEGRKLE